MTNINFNFIKQVGIFNYFYRIVKIKILRKINKKKFIYKLITNKNYSIYNWDPSAAEVYLTRCFTDWGNEYLFLDSIINRNNNIFLDIGCHSGYYPKLFEDYFNKIYGFEPSKKCIDILEKGDNKFQYYKYFVGNSEKVVTGVDSKSGYSFYHKNFNYEKTTSEKINQITLDRFCLENKLKNITAIKVDIDGLDMNVLYGAKQVIQTNRPSILIENYSQDLFDFFKDLDYSLIAMVSSKNKPYNLTLENLSNFNNNKWIKMICCVPNEFYKDYKNYKFMGNIFFGINKKDFIKNLGLNF